MSEETVHVLQVRTFMGEELVGELKEALRNLRIQGVSVPKIEADGKWSFKGYEVAILPGKNSVSPLAGHKALRVGERGKEAKGQPLMPLGESIVTVYAVAKGEPISGEALAELGESDMLQALTPEGKAPRAPRKTKADKLPEAKAAKAAKDSKAA